MAKMYGLGGVLSGKLGNTVLAVYNGVQVARQYQPIVNNPKTALQRAQRSKGNLAGRISSFVPAAALFGLGENKRARRSAFLSNILKKAVVVTSGLESTAKIYPADVLFSIGAVPISVYSPVVTAAANSVTVTLRGYAEAVVPAGYESMATRLVAMVYDSVSNDLVECVTAMAVKPEQGATADTRLPIFHPSGYSVAVYAVPMKAPDGTNLTVDTTMVGMSDDEIIASLSLGNAGVVFEYGRSILLGGSDYTPAP